MPLSEHEQRILEDIERRLQEEDPRFADQVARTSLHAHVARRIRWGTVLFLAGFVMLMLFAISVWVAIVGFGMMLTAALFMYQQIRRMGGEQSAGGAAGGSLSLPAILARWGQRFRGGRRSKE